MSERPSGERIKRYEKAKPSVASCSASNSFPRRTLAELYAGRRNRLKHVDADGSRAASSSCDNVNGRADSPPSLENPPIGTLEEPVLNWSTSARSGCSNSFITSQNSFTVGDSSVYPEYAQFARQSSMSIVGMPEMSSSSSNSSKRDSSARGTNDHSPLQKLAICFRIPRSSFWATRRWTYPCLFSSVTGISAPPGSSSTLSVLPKDWCSVEKLRSSPASEMSFSRIQLIDCMYSGSRDSASCRCAGFPSMCL
mmetsp:Transcript_29336/g.76893  ORF Transcript_29336/g.76893 Transcript_29336/m.76893 type:complete len:253 (-) Transcript_29336:2709-3467(-)